MNEIERIFKLISQASDLNQLSKEDFICTICTYIQSYADYNDVDKKMIATCIFSMLLLSKAEIRRMVEELEEED